MRRCLVVSCSAIAVPLARTRCRLMTDCSEAGRNQHQFDLVDVVDRTGVRAGWGHDRTSVPYTGRGGARGDWPDAAPRGVAGCWSRSWRWRSSSPCSSLSPPAWPGATGRTGRRRGSPTWSSPGTWVDRATGRAGTRPAPVVDGLIEANDVRGEQAGEAVDPGLGALGRLGPGRRAPRPSSLGHGSRRPGPPSFRQRGD